MPIEVWKTPSGQWFWTCRAGNGEVIGDSSELYSSRQKATQGAMSAAKEFMTWQKEQKPKKPARAITGRQKPAAKPSTSLNSQTRKTGKRGG